MDMFSYAPCIDYAYKLRSCATATPGLLAKNDYEVQASCACYNSIAPCDIATYATAFDDLASGCLKYLQTVGNYTHAASAMDASSIIGLNFCASVSAAFTMASSNFSLPATISPATCTPTPAFSTESWPRPSTSSNTNTGSTQARSRLIPFLTPFDHRILVCRDIFLTFVPCSTCVGDVRTSCSGYSLLDVLVDCSLLKGHITTQSQYIIIAFQITASMHSIDIFQGS